MQGRDPLEPLLSSPSNSLQSALHFAPRGIFPSSNSHPLSSHSTQKLATEILQRTENSFYANLAKMGIILIHSQWMSIVLAAASFLTM